MAKQTPPPVDRYRGRLRVLLTAVLAAALALVAACGGGTTGSSASGGAKTAMPDQVRVYTCCVSGTEIPLWLAYDKGLFAKNGIKVSDLKLLPPPTGLQALSAGSVDIGNDTPGGVIAAAAADNKNVELVAGKTSKPVYYIMTNKLTHPKDLRGKRLGVSNKYAAPAVAAYTYLQDQLGFKLDRDYHVVPFAKISDLVPALAQGTIDAAVLSAPLNFASEAQGSHVLADLRGTVEEANSWVTVSKQFADQYPAAVTAYIKTITEAMELAKSDNGAAIASIMKHQSGVSRKVAEQTYQAYIGVFDPFMYEKALEPYTHYASTQMIANTNPKSVMDTTFIDKLEKDGFFKAHGFTRNSS